MDLLFFQLWKIELEQEFLNRGFRRAYFSNGMYYLEFSHQVLQIFLHSGDSIGFYANPQEVKSGKGFQKTTKKHRLADHNGFTKQLDSHLKKSKLAKIEMVENDRIILLNFQKTNLYGNKIEYKLILELINRFENIILTKKTQENKWRIIDCHKKIGIEDSRFRQILPGSEYIFPPKQKKPNIFNLAQNDFNRQLKEPLPEKWKKFIRYFSNMPKYLGEFYPGNRTKDQFWKVIEKSKVRIATVINKIDEEIIENGDNFICFYDRTNRYLSIYESDNSYGFIQVNSAFKFYYEEKLKKGQLQSLKAKILKRFRKKRKSIKRALKKERDALKDLKRVDEWKKFGELLKSNFHRIKPRQEKIVVVDYFNEGTPEITIPLNAELNAEGNMEFYFKKYKKAKSGIKKLKKQIVKNQKRIDETEKLIVFIENNDDEEYLFRFKKNQRAKHKIPNYKKKFREYSFTKSKKEWKIYVGRDRKENDELSTKFANSDDWFFHSRTYHGSHVIVRNPDKSESLPQDVTIYAARIAAHFSKAKHSTKVPVDYTKAKYVSKPRKSPPGFVIYRNQKTLFVEPLDPRK